MGKKQTVDEKDKTIEKQKQEIEFLTNMVVSMMDFIDATENSFSNMRDKAKRTLANSPMNREFAKSLEKKG